MSVSAETDVSSPLQRRIQRRKLERYAFLIIMMVTGVVVVVNFSAMTRHLPECHLKTPLTDKQ